MNISINQIMILLIGVIMLHSTAMEKTILSAKQENQLLNYAQMSKRIHDFSKSLSKQDQCKHLHNVANAFLISSKINHIVYSFYTCDIIPIIKSTLPYRLVDDKIISCGLPYIKVPHVNVIESSAGELIHCEEDNLYFFRIEQANHLAFALYLHKLQEKYQNSPSCFERLFIHVLPKICIHLNSSDEIIKRLTGNLMHKIIYNYFCSYLFRVVSTLSQLTQEKYNFHDKIPFTVEASIPHTDCTEKFNSLMLNVLAIIETVHVVQSFAQITQETWKPNLGCFVANQETIKSFENLMPLISKTVKIIPADIIQEYIYQEIIDELKKSLHTNNIQQHQKKKKKKGKTPSKQNNKKKQYKQFFSILPAIHAFLGKTEHEKQLPDILTIKELKDAALEMRRQAQALNASYKKQQCIADTAKVQTAETCQTKTVGIIQEIPLLHDATPTVQAESEMPFSALINPIPQTPEPIKSINTCINYDSRILQWLDPHFACEQSATALLYHIFSFLADPYIKAHGELRKYSNKKRGTVDNHYHLPGNIESYDQHGKKNNQFVVFTLCFDPNDICYHRGFERRTWNELYQENKEKYYYQTQFPPLETATQITMQKYYNCQEDEYGSKVIEDTELSTQIWDNKSKVTLWLYKVYK